MAEVEVAPVSYEDLALIEEEFAEVDDEIQRKQHELSKPLYAKRAEAVSKIPNFWPLVMEQAPMEIEDYITPLDSAIFAEHLTNLTVTRPELEEGKSGNPKTFSIKFEFSENEYFEDKVLEKTFWHRRAADDWVGLVSEPVKIHWKKGKDSTDGLTNAALALFEARKKVGDFKSHAVPEYKALEKKVEANGGNTSFFTWFGWVSNRRYVTAEESEKANKEYAQRKAARKGGEKPDAPLVEKQEEEDDEEDDSMVEVHAAGEEIAVTISDEMWPNAIKLFVQAQEAEDISDIDMEEFDDEEIDAAEDEPVDIRSLVQSTEKRSRDSSGAPPPKKAKK
ncbi:nucleosome assembly protein family [Hortaea werneckii]|uniref:Nap family protein n=2 Tax=Hortaea werneckii TaxID=91943 RepID=A0A3M7HEB6_HORWE|nr:nucleosome assembly protein family [Hortaea werneckii]OTA20017.1 hypothetical protein BTJ68_15115 [Hortaea werneckii EXF-2000]KAI6802164.1 nucleosome assembly protein family [Hortaea werneckii]KAI6903327.1 nucleosome assembly protein family [Hortaea werneckii]KAI6922037.1 nucleosome assembly protein family [Hortaea werneckii]